jgi:hypothetical protein
VGLVFHSGPLADEFAFISWTLGHRRAEELENRETQLGVSELLTPLNVPLMLWPSVLIMVMQATRMSANMTAYSTAVGPSSLERNREIERTTLCIELVLLERDAEIRDGQSILGRFHSPTDFGDRARHGEVDFGQHPKRLVWRVEMNS